jgi:hypothetical protein
MDPQVDSIETPVTPRSVGIKYGLISTVIAIVFFLALVFTGQDAFDQNWGWVRVVISVVILILAHKNFKDTGDGYMSYGQGVGIAFWITLVSLVLGLLFTYGYVTFIDAGIMDTFYDTQIEKLEAQGMADAQIETAMTWTKKLFWPISIFFGLLFGVLVGVFVSIFTQKKNPEPTF